MNELHARVWQNKKTKEKVTVLPWWECPEPLADNKLIPLKSDAKYKIGALLQVGWLIKNKHGVWLGVNLEAAKHFKDLGEWKKKK